MARTPERGPLRVATFNAGMMSTFILNWDVREDPLGAFVASFTSIFTDADARDIGHRLADMVLGAPYDVVVFNEIFHADTREALVSRAMDPARPATTRYDWVVAGLGPELRSPSPPQRTPRPVLEVIAAVVDVEVEAVAEAWDDLVEGPLRSWMDDSGLLLLSRVPLLPIPVDGGGTSPWVYDRYLGATGWDALAPKGIGAVALTDPNNMGPVVLGFTHMQSDEGGDPNVGIRVSQLRQVDWLMTETMRSLGTPHGVLLGDLNIPGRPDASGVMPSEWDRHLSPATGDRAAVAWDGWTQMLMPGRAPDLCLSHPGSGERLDYVVCYDLSGSTPATAPEAFGSLGVQHLSLARELRLGSTGGSAPIGLAPVDLAAPPGTQDVSDHVGVSAIIGHRQDGSSPSTARDGTLPPAPVGKPPQPLPVEWHRVQHGEVRWLSLPGGSYRLDIEDDDGQVPPLVDVRLFRPADLSAQLPDRRRSTDPVQLREGRVITSTEQEVLVRLHRLDTDTESRTVRLEVHAVFGRTSADAVGLQPWVPSHPLFWPQESVTASPVEPRWHEVQLDDMTVPTQPLRFRAVNRAGDPVPVEIELFPGTERGTDPSELDAPLSSVATDEETGTTPVVTWPAVDPRERTFLARVRSRTGTQEEVSLEVQVELHVLRYMHFYCLDESGTDRPFSDTIDWVVRSDLPGVAPVGGVVPGVDTDPRRPHTMLVAPLAFTTSVAVELEELGSGEKTAAQFVVPGAGEADGADHAQDKDMPDWFSDGRYRLAYSWSRRPR
ncbi:hypothetical protein J1G43_05365 [Cellulomonas sp. zg-ZUI22]|uniref:hypothetical protein n=1 Tax=Cellulomonas sp. zg-ZUI22 TaxID=2816955 RepID=UPI001A93DB2C|nr:hypothetical protein [Cellulomonas sp. zg-ZUI22]MBO0899391.1 hypothetical protein [Cellulomonas sp. zg-ZUI22]